MQFPPTEEVWMPDRQWIIGSDLDVDVFLGESVVSRRHCRLSLHHSQYFIEDLASRNGTFMGETRIVTRTAIDAGAEIMLAGSVPMPWPDEALALEILSIGRVAGNDIEIDDDSVSSKHAILFRDPNNRWLIRDLGSTNGTRLGDQKIVSMTCLKPSDVVRFGSVAETLSSLRRQVNSSPAQPNSSGSGTTKKNVGFVVPSKSDGGGSLTVVREFWREFPPAAQFVSVGCVLVCLASVLWWMLSDQGTSSDALANRNDMAKNQAGEITPRVLLEEPSVDDKAVDEAEITPPAIPRPQQAMISKPLENSSSRSNQPSLESRLRESFYWVIVSSDGHSFRLGAALAIDDRRLLTPVSTINRLLELGESMPSQVCNVMDRSVASLNAVARHPNWLKNHEIDETSTAVLPDLLSRYRSEGSDPNSEIGKQLTIVYRRAIAAQNNVRSFGVGLLRVDEPLKHHMANFDSQRDANAWLSGPSATVRKMVKSPLVGPFFDSEEVFVDEQTNFQWTSLRIRLLLGSPTFRIGKISLEKDSNIELSGAAVLDDQGRFAGMLTNPGSLPIENRAKFKALLDPDDVTYDWVPRDNLRLIQNLDVSTWQSLPVPTNPPQ